MLVKSSGSTTALTSAWMMCKGHTHYYDEKACSMARVQLIIPDEDRDRFIQTGTEGRVDVQRLAEGSGQGAAGSGATGGTV